MVKPETIRHSDEKIKKPTSIMRSLTLGYVYIYINCFSDLDWRPDPLSCLGRNLNFTWRFNIHLEFHLLLLYILEFYFNKSLSTRTIEHMTDHRVLTKK